MTTYLLYGDALRHPEVRHEIAEPIGDPIVFIEHDGRRIVVGSTLDEPVLSKRDDVVDEFWNIHELGSDELVGDHSLSQEMIWPELTRRAVAKVGADKVSVPAGFSVLVADHLRNAGVDVDVDPVEWSMRRRRKNAWELEGIERAQRAAETAMLTAARMLRDAEPTQDGRLRFEGEILTAELVREAMSQELTSQGAESEEILVQSGDACLRGHDLGHGPIQPDQTCIIDCFPRDRRTGAFTDMTRTFVPGTPSARVVELHDLCRRALEVAFDSLVVGRNDAFAKVCEFFEAHGMPTRLSHTGEEELRSGFYHALGHGVGLEVHERPSMGRRSDELVAGDVVAIEPGLYFEGVGGVRLEDTVLISEDGVVRFTDPFPYELQP